MDVPIERRFRGSVRLVTLHLWRVAKSTNLEEGFAAARSLGMLNTQHEAFIRRCLTLDAQLEAGTPPDDPLTQDLVNELQLCAIRLNAADPA